MTVLDALTVAEAISDVSAKSVILPSNGHALGACVGTRCDRANYTHRGCMRAIPCLMYANRYHHLQKRVPAGGHPWPWRLWETRVDEVHGTEQGKGQGNG